MNPVCWRKQTFPTLHNCQSRPRPRKAFICVCQTEVSLLQRLAFTEQVYLREGEKWVEELRGSQFTSSLCWNKVSLPTSICASLGRWQLLHGGILFINRKCFAKDPLTAGAGPLGETVTQSRRVVYSNLPKAEAARWLLAQGWALECLHDDTEEEQRWVNRRTVHDWPSWNMNAFHAFLNSSAKVGEAVRRTATSGIVIGVVLL